MTKGIILAGGSGTRLYPASKIMSKHLQIVYDKPMIYYPLSTLMLAGIREILIITTPEDLNSFKKLLGNGQQFGLQISYCIQESPKGIAEAFILAEAFIGSDQVCLILGDNIFYGKLDYLRDAIKNNIGGTIFAYEVNNPEDFGVISLDNDANISKIEEKPKNPTSNLAIPGLYVFNNQVIQIAKSLKPSNRNELEITDIHLTYLKNDTLKYTVLGRGIVWLDTGTPDNLLEASQFIYSIEKRQGRKIACPEEIALLMNFVSWEFLESHINLLPDCSYKVYCKRVVNEFQVKKIEVN